MPQVTAAVSTDYLGALHAQAVIRNLPDCALLRLGVKTGPAAVGLELGARIEQHLAAAAAAVEPVLEDIPVLAGKGPLGTRLAANVKFFRSQPVAPVVIVFFF